MRRRGLDQWKPYDWKSWRWWPRWVWILVGAETVYALYFTASFGPSAEFVRVPMFAGARPLILGEQGLLSTFLWINLWTVIGMWVSARLEMNVRNERQIALVVVPPALVLLAISVLIWQYAEAWWIYPVDTVIERLPSGDYGIVAQREAPTVTGLHDWLDSLGR